MQLDEIYKLFLSNPAISTDSRDIKPNSIFFALKGENFDGNAYAKSAIEKGASYAIIDNNNFKIDDRYILVDNVLKTLQNLANFHRKQMKAKIIGITGSNGKTTSKELINAVLSQKYATIYTKGNLNNHIGVPLTLLSLTKDTDIGIIEMGANHPNEIKLLCEIAEPEFGIITNIGKAHIEGFGNYEGVINTKKELYDFLFTRNGIVFINFDNQLLMQINNAKEFYSYGKDSTNYISGKLVSMNPFIKIEWSNRTNKSYQIQTNLIGSYNTDNVLAAILIGKYFNVEDSAICSAIENYTPSNNRSQLIKGKSNNIVMDAYNANPSSMEVAIKNFHEIDFPEKTLIIGDMLELGVISETEHLTVTELISKLHFKNVFLVGKTFCKINNNSLYKTYCNVDELTIFLKQNPIQNNYILVKGSRGIKLEKVLEFIIA
ncbi:MAG: UDP-N-acetylmuramoyl-tripeptide--D-alanyl-D-alanine ligase [Bacteroidetes bacterium GWA2_30_7]|nr:MAG: UDP-N-acetylmuramoyl-tripeptide--D-alanyl-D-alanine ligase [Bacteroidetes bacterium GWA2_30_7]